MKFYVYVYRDPSRRNEPIYVGKGQDDRAYDHLKHARNPHFKNRLAKMKANGIEPIINVVNLPSEALAIQCEIDTIARFGRKDLGLGPVLNMTDGGEGSSGWIPTEENRKNMSDAQKGEKSYWFGKSHTEAAKQKQSNAKKGKPSPNKGKTASPESRQKMSDAQKGENNPNYGKPAHNRGKSPSADARQKNSDAHKGKVQPKLVCPHCGELSGPSRHHFDKCKQKREASLPFNINS